MCLIRVTDVQWDIWDRIGYQTYRIEDRGLEDTEGAIKNGQSRETGIIGYTRRRKTKQIHNTICIEHHCKQAFKKTLHEDCFI